LNCKETLHLKRGLSADALLLRFTKRTAQVFTILKLEQRVWAWADVLAGRPSGAFKGARTENSAEVGLLPEMQLRADAAARPRVSFHSESAESLGTEIFLCDRRQPRISEIDWKTAQTAIVFTS